MQHIADANHDPIALGGRADQDDTHADSWAGWCGGGWRSDRIDTLGWGAVLIWGGLVLFADVTGFASTLAWWEGWSMFLAGAGAIVLLLAGVRRFMLGQRRGVVGSAICGGMLLAFGLGDLIVWIWPAVLIAIGVLIVRQAIASPPRDGSPA